MTDHCMVKLALPVGRAIQYFKKEGGKKRKRKLLVLSLRIQTTWEHVEISVRNRVINVAVGIH